MRNLFSHLPAGVRLLCGALLVLSAAGGATTTSSISLTSSPNPSLIGQPVTITATVTAGATGQVAFYDGGTMLGVSTVASGQATFSTRLLPSGRRSLRAHYSGDAVHLASDSLTLAQVVTALPANGFQQVMISANVNNNAVVGDFNGDGKQDLAFFDYQGVNVLLGRGDGSFQASVTSPGGANPVSITVGDFNGDGISDFAVIASNGTTNVLSVLLGKGDGAFRATVPHTSGINNPSFVAVADFNGDGKADLLVSGNSSISVLPGNGDGAFQDPVTFSFNWTGGPIVADFNGDGKPDLAFNGSDTLIVLLGNGDGTFRGPVTDMYHGYYWNVNAMAVGDINGDGKPDLIALGSNAFSFLGNGDGTFQAPVTSNVTIYAVTVAVGDFNGDGNADLAFADGSGSVGLCFGNGNGTLQPPLPISNTAYGLLVVGEFNGDGRTDFILNQPTTTTFLGTVVPDLTVTETHAGSFAPGTINQIFSITVSNLPFASTNATVTVTDTLPSGLTATAINGPGWNCTLASLTCTRSDSLVAGGSYPVVTITVSVASNVPSSIINTATVSGGGMPPASKKATDTIITRTTTTTLASSPNPSTFGQPVTLTALVTAGASGQVTFYDGATVLGVSALLSGQASLVTQLLATGNHALRARYDPDAISLWPAGNSAGINQAVTPVPASGWQAAANYPAAAPANFVVLADFNGDGKTDMAVAGGSVVSVLAGKGDGTFGAAVNSTVAGAGASTGPLAVADLNSDGKPDLVVAYHDSSGGSGFKVLLFNGDGTFLPPALYTIGTTGSGDAGLVVADFNGDGKADVAFTSGGVLYLFLGKGDGTLQLPSNISIGSGGWWIVAADLNGDGKADLVYLNGCPVGVVLGNGDGTFQPALSLAGLGCYSSPLMLADFNGDGKLDLVAGGYGGYPMSVLFGNGDGTFQAPKATNIAGNTILAAADLNGDGKADLVSPGPDNVVNELLGNGDGTFQPPVSVLMGGAPVSAVVGEFNGDGRVDLAFANGAAGTVSVLLGSRSAAVAISGNVNLAGSGLSGVTVTLSGSQSSSAVTDTGGNYSFTVAAGGTYTLTPSLSGYTFSSPSQTFNNVTTNQNANFTATLTTYTISGTAATLNNALGGVTVTLSGSQSGSAVTDAGGKYSFNVVPSGSYTITPSLNGYSFSPPSQTFTNPSDSQTANFSATVATYTISGKVTLSGSGLSGMAVTLSGSQSGSTVTDSSGNYSFTALTAGGTYTITPSGGNYTFNPPNETFNNVINNQTGNFTATTVTYTVSGIVSTLSNALGGVTVTLSGNQSSSTVTDTGGNYSFNVAAGGTYTVTPSRTYYTFNPPSQTFKSLTGNQTANFIATLAPYTISGIVTVLNNGLSAVTVTLSGSQSGSTVSDSGGNYTLSVAAGGTYSIAPSRAGYTFTPPSQLFTSLTANAIANFSALPGVSTVSGTITSSGYGLGGVTVALSGGQNGLSLTDSSGNYSFTVATGGNYTVTPTYNGYAFNPPSQTLSNVMGTQAANFAATSTSVGSRINLTVWRPASGMWYLNPANGPSVSQQWGLPGDIPVTADVNGDGVLDCVVWRPTNGTWYVTLANSATPPFTRQWGLPGDIPAAGDFDGDGKTDYAVWRPATGTWYIVPSGNPPSTIVKQWGLPNDMPIVADFDGDGKADFAVWRPAESNWHITLSRTGATVVKQWGLPGDLPVAADFDGDAKADYAVWRPSNGTWYVIPSGTGVPYVKQWGLPGDIPVPVDYDLDGKADMAVWRPSNGTWYIIPSARPAAPLTVQWGLPDDVPVYKPAGN